MVILELCQYCIQWAIYLPYLLYYCIMPLLSDVVVIYLSSIAVLTPNGQFLDCAAIQWAIYNCTVTFNSPTTCISNAPLCDYSFEHYIKECNIWDLIAVFFKFQVVWDITPIWLVHNYRRFVGTVNLWIRQLFTSWHVAQSQGTWIFRISGKFNDKMTEQKVHQMNTRQKKILNIKKLNYNSTT